MQSDVTVTQADRNMAADWYRDCMNDEHIARMIDRGENDNMLVLAFARHRANHAQGEAVAWMIT